AALCLSLLMGYSVSMYANSEDEAKKKTVLRRSQMILKKLSPTSLRFQLSTICNQF
ncbi:transcriptional regulator, partial [Bacteroides thetaiotaomicron]